MPIKKRRYKQSPLERKSIGITSGVYGTNKKQLEKIKKADITKPREQVPLSDFYMRIKNEWVYKGKSCRLCGTLFNDPIVIDKHRYVCKVLNKVTEDDDDANS